MAIPLRLAPDSPDSDSDETAPVVSFPALSTDVYCQIFDGLPQVDLCSLRLVNRHFGAIATGYLFRHVRLELVNRGPTLRNFMWIAQQRHLAALVREVTISAVVVPIDGESEVYFGYCHRSLLELIPFLTCFDGVKTLNIRFQHWFGLEDFQECSENFRFALLAVVFQCMTGSWLAQWQTELMWRLGLSGDDHQAQYLPFEYSVLEAYPPALDINTLTIGNLTTLDVGHITSLPSFRQLISSGKLRDFKLNTFQWRQTGLIPHQDDDFFGTLPKTWLAPPLAQNLRVLSLYSNEYWGWFPKMDFRLVNPGNGGFPDLQELALGMYVFSHEWQVRWIAPLGRANGGAGLKKLYLDDCPIMWQARVPPLDDSKTVFTVNGTNREVSNEGYPIPYSLDDLESVDLDFVEKNFYNLRWNRVLDYWRENMLGLQVFKMGANSNDPEWFIKSAQAAALFERRHERYQHLPDVPVPKDGRLHDPRQYRSGWEFLPNLWEDESFVNYACDGPARDDSDVPFDMDYRHGIGMFSSRLYVLLYMSFDVGIEYPGWVEGDNRHEIILNEGLETYEVAKKLDEEAYENLVKTTTRRAVEIRG